MAVDEMGSHAKRKQDCMQSRILSARGGCKEAGSYTRYINTPAVVDYISRCRSMFQTDLHRAVGQLIDTAGTVKPAVKANVMSSRCWTITDQVAVN